MKFGFIGLGRMGFNMVLNALDHGQHVVVYNRSPEKTTEAAAKGAIPTFSLPELLSQLPSPKVVWLMIVAGQPVDDMLEQLLPLLSAGDIVIDGGNSYFKDSIRRHQQLKEKGIHYLDCGTSGGMEGARYGACMMVGGEKEVFQKVEELFREMSGKDGYGYMGSAGAGHFVKSIHNGIEYGMMGAIAEGVQAIKDSPLNIDPHHAVKVYAHGSIVESKLISWLLKSYDTPAYLNHISGEVPKGETEEEMLQLTTLAPLPILEHSVRMRQATRQNPSYAGKLLAAMRNQFGGHAVKEQK